MFAARDQENVVHGLQQAAASKPLNQNTRTLQPKTPGARFPKTPLRVPLNDENNPGGFGGKTNLGTKGKGLGGKLDTNSFVTPLGPRTGRAPLGAKTTNAKAKNFQTPGAGPAPVNLDKSQHANLSASTRRPKPKVQEKAKVAVHPEDSPLAEERDVEYLPPKPKELPYESDVFPKDCLNYDMLKKGNLMRGWLGAYNRPVDENGKTEMDRTYEASYAKAAKELDEHVLAAMDEDWTIGDVPETFKLQTRKKSAKDPLPLNPTEQAKKAKITSRQGPPTLTSKRAASALSVAPKSTVAPPKTSFPKPAVFKPTIPLFGRNKTMAPVPTNPSTATVMRHTAATVNSRTTIGYNKGRTASSILPRKNSTKSVSSVTAAPPVVRCRQGPALLRTNTTSSEASEATMTPLRFAEDERRRSSDELHRLTFLQAFEVDDDELEPGLRGALPECLREEDEDEVEFVMLPPAGASDE